MNNGIYGSGINISFSLGKLATVFQAELYAIINSLRAIINEKLSNIKPLSGPKQSTDYIKTAKALSGQEHAIKKRWPNLPTLHKYKVV